MDVKYKTRGRSYEQLLIFTKYLLDHYGEEVSRDSLQIEIAKNFGVSAYTRKNVSSELYFCRLIAPTPLGVKINKELLEKELAERGLKPTQ